MLASLICAAVLCAAPNDAELIENLKANWESQRSAIVTAHFRARAFRSGTMEPLSEAELDAAFNSVDLAIRPDDLRKLVPIICKDKVFSTPDPWSAIEVYVDGPRLRERSINTPGALDDSVVDDGITVISLGGANQASILRTSDNTRRIRNLDDFRFTPAITLGTRVSSRKSGRVRFVEPGEPHSEFDVDEATGFVHSWRFYVKDGAIDQEILQFGPVSYPGDVLLPTAIAKLRFGGGRLAFADILVVEEAELNVDLPGDAFVVNASQGTVIADERDRQKRDVFRAKRKMDDLVKSFPLVARTQPTPGLMSSTVALTLLAVGVIVIVLLVFLYRRPLRK